MKPKPSGLGAVTLLTALLVALTCVMDAPARPAYAAGTINVSTGVDEFGTGANCSLREAIRTANSGANFGGCTLSATAPFTINVPAGTYNLAILGSNENADATGDLDVTASGTIIQGAGAAPTIIQWNPAVADASRDRVLEINPGLSPNFNFTLTGVTIKGGRDNSGIGGGGMISGSAANTNGTVTISNCAFNDNKVPVSAGSPVGGAIGHAGGTLNVSNCTFDSNSSTGSGGAIYFDPFGAGSFTLSNSTFTNNTSMSGNGGAIRNGVTTGASGPTTISSSRFVGNTAQGVNGTGGAIFNESGILNVTTSSFESNQITNQSGQKKGFLEGLRPSKPPHRVTRVNEQCETAATLG